MSRLVLLAFTLALLAHLTLAAPPQPWYEKYNQRRVIVPQSYYEALSLRRQAPVKPNAVRDMVCLDTSTRFLLYDEYAASLAICGSIAGPGATRCEGNPAETVGTSGRAAFALQATERDRGATINVSKEAWARCVAAAREACPQGRYRGVCVGGATKGDVSFELMSV
ncbi:hypothetical protein MYCTH_2295999 [Thermothelomyces thermophilus ATCC 42464]|uniref:Uncharacterized protein n=1 Tax=Thermothelomyces thermophilus (strain ATCC 42464 / BCRC 31852 / DSM 1799) TaxID=573729 RepID=G2PZW9_THET4|nr:uncharacterized protein MYCTH_2295999 [Thermothelomyces thermophilus ATCC 42464]AEO53992.1 hypothetical protein MYCTH_2295999 [Thermothelomyces thermophilus ATCC 42464]